ncbi:hypothetical protein NIES3804_25940 [Microcystis aeruginosa NIES-3804]|uniref:Uncharacterized protein n=1 Tax=Microcystis aeruginosa NIES-3804 TaxID=2517783 RepID=A0A6H9G771_MICAE|nr:hypothetical protein [Microcystis aeruginosa]GCL51021.1 hypothetical protein NIES3804_25940 [Microcystis aeruginosa NIES-3804]
MVRMWKSSPIGFINARAKGLDFQGEVGSEGTGKYETIGRKGLVN